MKERMVAVKFTPGAIAMLTVVLTISTLMRNAPCFWLSV
jgi:hypothetical protein